MTGKEALEIIESLDKIYYLITQDYENEGFYELGKLSQRLQHIVDVDMASFNPTVENDNEM